LGKIQGVLTGKGILSTVTFASKAFDELSLVLLGDPALFSGVQHALVGTVGAEEERPDAAPRALHGELKTCPTFAIYFFSIRLKQHIGYAARYHTFSEKYLDHVISLSKSRHQVAPLALELPLCKSTYLRMRLPKKQWLMRLTSI
jgi:hypothetical protein